MSRDVVAGTWARAVGQMEQKSTTVPAGRLGVWREYLESVLG